MPRQGEGHIAHNAVETGHDIIRGAGKEEATQSSRVDRADKTASLPTQEGGLAIKGMNASGGGSQGLAEGPNAGQGGRSTKT